ncbi:hypothetical protein OUZ56_008407 [Daphnia magna]|uniref:Uncharacterized protein n=1 Tax=Daphnia magna TaxID=35525 RepID=A0ABR0ACV9_9CRUS|nr:hypothetical protein OUZ56_008407 [Daphnia magna]
MSYTRIYLAVAVLYLATVQLPFTAANNQVALTLSPLYKSRRIIVDMHGHLPGRATYSLSSAFSLVSPWLTSRVLPHLKSWTTDVLNT